MTLAPPSSSLCLCDHLPILRAARKKNMGGGAEPGPSRERACPPGRPLPQRVVRALVR
jgi:hypothetical protein